MVPRSGHIGPATGGIISKRFRSPIQFNYASAFKRAGGIVVFSYTHECFILQDISPRSMW